MPYGIVKASKEGRKISIEIELPDRGEPSQTGRSENFVNPRAWKDVEDADGQWGIKVTVCRPYGRQRT